MSWIRSAYNDGAIKWTSTVTNRMMLDAGFSMNQEQYVIQNQDGINKPFGSPEWIAGAMRRDSALITRRNGIGSGQGGRYPDRYNMQGAVSYVTSAHNFKTGVQYNWGPYVNTRETNGDLEQFYLNGVPSTVTIYNTPLRSKEALVATGGRPDRHVWMLGAKRFDARPCREQADEAHVADAGFLQPIDRCDCRVPGGEHRIDDDHQPLVAILGRLEIIFDRLERERIAIEADMGEARRGHEIEHPLGHLQAGAKDRRDDQFLA